MTRRTFLAAGAATAAAPLLLRIPSAFAGPEAVTDFGFPPRDQTGRYVKDITFPVAGFVSWVDTYGACRDGCKRHHEGQDLFGKKGQNLIAAVDGTVVVLRHTSSGNSLYLKSDADGWFYSYLHINDDTPGTDDGRNAYSQAFAPHIVQGAHVRRGQVIAYLGDSGNAEATSPHCHFEIRKPASSVWHSQAVNAKYSLLAAKTDASSAPSGAAQHSSAVAVPSGTPPMRQGDSGSRVVALQQAMNVGAGTHLTRDGEFGPATDKAVRNVQAWCRVVPDGVYGPKTQFAMRVACRGR
ncbi:MAG: peptidoglycan DD-metalloendopeptidase family protein [Actinomycetota bacterium]|nr:peptidoglycan DD-metalloendopeptidase family protein [Actinomycetota bacterium]